MNLFSDFLAEIRSAARGIAADQGLVLIRPYQGDSSVTAFTLDGSRVAWAYQPTQ